MPKPFSLTCSRMSNLRTQPSPKSQLITWRQFPTRNLLKKIITDLKKLSKSFPKPKIFCHFTIKSSDWSLHMKFRTMSTCWWRKIDNTKKIITILDFIKNCFKSTKTTFHITESINLLKTKSTKSLQTENWNSSTKNWSKAKKIVSGLCSDRSAEISLLESRFWMFRCLWLSLSPEARLKGMRQNWDVLQITWSREPKAHLSSKSSISQEW